MFIGIGVLLTGCYGFMAAVKAANDSGRNTWKFSWYSAIAIACTATAIIGLEIARGHVHWNPQRGENILSHDSNVVIDTRMVVLKVHHPNEYPSWTDTTWVVRIAPRTDYMYSTKPHLWLMVDQASFERMRIGASARYHHGQLNFDTLVRFPARYTPTYAADSCNAVVIDKP